MNNERRRQATQHKIVAKLDVLRLYIADGVPRGAFVPTSLNQFRMWESSELGLVRIGSPGTLNAKLSSHNALFVQEAAELMGKLHRRTVRPKRERKGVQRENEDLRDVVQTKQAENSTLVSRLHEAREEARGAKEELSALRERVRMLEEEIHILRRRLGSKAVTRLRPVE